MQRRSFLQACLALFGAAAVPRQQSVPSAQPAYIDSDGNAITTELNDQNAATGIIYAA